MSIILKTPDVNSISEHCAVMRINYPGVVENKNWESTTCRSDQNGQLGESHGFICIEDKHWKPIEESDCVVIFPTTTTTTTKTTTTSSGSGPEGPEGSGEGSGGNEGGQSSELLIQIVWIITGSFIAFSYTLIRLFTRRYSRSKKSSHIF
jgi:hypothetical protein